MQIRQTLEVLSVCMCRRASDLNCRDCKFKGEQCYQAHERAITDIKELRLIKNERKKNE